MAIKKKAAQKAPAPMPMLKHHEPTRMLQYTLTQCSPFKDGYDEASGRIFATYNHREHCRHNGDPVRENWCLNNAVTLWDVWVEKWTRVTGPDAAAFVDMLTPRDISKCHAGQGKYVFITRENGSILNDPVLYRLGENDLLLTAADSDLDLWAQGVAVNSGMDVDITTPDGAMVQVQGPNSPDVMVDLFGESILEMGYYWLVECERDDKNRLRAKPGAKVWRKLTCLDGVEVDVFVARTGFSGLVGFEIGLWDAHEHGTRFWKTVLQAVKNHDGMHIGPGHEQRIKERFLSFGNDIDRDGALAATPLEVLPETDWKWAVPETKEAWYIGKEALQRQRAEGITRKLVSIDIKGDPVGYFNDDGMTRPWPVYSRDEVVWLPKRSKRLEDGSVQTPHGKVYDGDDVFEMKLGGPELIDRMYYLPETAKKLADVTSATWLSSYETNAGLAILPLEYARPGVNLTVLTEHGLRDAMVVVLFDEEKKSVPHADLTSSRAA